MRKKEWIMAVVIFILGLNMVNNIGAQGNDSKLELISSALEKRNIEVSEWSLYSKKNIEKKSISEVKQMTSQYRQYTWTFMKENEVFKAVGIRNDVEKAVTEKFQIITTLTNHHSQTYMLFEVLGTKEIDNWNAMSEAIHAQIFDIFQEDSAIYACMMGTVSDKMKDSLINETDIILGLFQAEPVEELTEENFLSISAKTPLWEDFIPTNEDKMNMQIALRTDGLGGKTTVVIGTPIITSEY
ncbi:YwmB family TATA-box binding protein [Metabacillus sp. HB246100]